jgi:hypothetical protein
MNLTTIGGLLWHGDEFLSLLIRISYRQNKFEVKSAIRCYFMPCGSLIDVNVSEEYGASIFRLEESSDLNLEVSGFSESSVTLKEHSIVSQKIVIFMFGVVGTSHIICGLTWC